MPEQRYDPQLVARAIEAHPTISAAAAALGVSERNMYKWRTRAERDLGIRFPVKHSTGGTVRYTQPDGPAIIREAHSKPLTVAICSDIHAWGRDPPAWRLFLQVVDDAKPDALILNGDVMDLPNASKFSATTMRDLRQRPQIEQEIAACQSRLSDLTAAAPKARRLWLLGNHCIRFERYVITHAPALAGTKGASLDDHFPGWQFAAAVFWNDTVAIKHTIRGSLHASYLNTLHAGLSTVTGHTHRLTVRAITDYRGVRFGCESGFIGAIDDDSGVWNYTDANPLNWQPGWLMGELDGDYWGAEPVHVLGDRARWRGRRYVDGRSAVKRRKAA